MEGYALRPWRLGEEESRKKIISLACCFSLSQSRKGRKGCAGYVGLSDLCGLARKKYPARRNLWQRRRGRKGSAGYTGLYDLYGLARKKYPARRNLWQRRRGRKGSAGKQVFVILTACREKISREKKGSRKGAEIAKEGTIHVRIGTL